MPLKKKTVKTATLELDPGNLNVHTDESIEAIRGSLERFGQQRPIRVDGKNVVRAGNGTLQAAIALGWDTIEVVVSDLPEEELRAFAIADNRTAEKSTWDEDGPTFAEVAAERLPEAASA